MATILIIDDENSVRNLIRLMLSHAGYVVYGASDGVSGLEAFWQYRPDLVLVDYFIPGKNGLEVIQAIREQAAETKIIAMTGYDIGLKEFREAGIDDVLFKPFKMQVLLEKIKGCLG